MAGLIIKRFSQPDERRAFKDKGHADFVRVGDRSVLHGVFEPGWRWSEHVKPLAGTRSCEVFHACYILSGRMHLRMDDGQEGEVGPGDVMVCEPGHDAWVVGDEPCVLVDFGANEAYARPARGRAAEQRPEQAPPAVH